jgi:galactose mutarotase-like enzyme
MSYEDFDYLGIWTKPQQDATYVCLEPWCGLADRSDSDGVLERKTAIQSLEPGNKRYYVHRIAFF